MAERLRETWEMDVLQRAEYSLAFFGDDKDTGDDDSVDPELAMGVDEVQEDAEGAGGAAAGNGRSPLRKLARATDDGQAHEGVGAAAAAAEARPSVAEMLRRRRESGGGT